MNLILSSIVFPSYLHDLRVVHQVQLQRGPRHGQLLHRHHHHRGRRRRSAIFGLVRLVLRRRSRRRRLWRISARASAPQRDENLRYKKTIYYLGTLQKMASRFINSNNFINFLSVQGGPTGFYKEKVITLGCYFVLFRSGVKSNFTNPREHIFRIRFHS